MPRKQKKKGSSKKGGASKTWKKTVAETKKANPKKPLSQVLKIASKKYKGGSSQLP